MSNNNSKASATRRQIVYSAPRKLFVKTVTKTRKDGSTYEVNVYKPNPDAKPVKSILHKAESPVTKAYAYNQLKDKKVLTSY